MEDESNGSESRVSTSEELEAERGDSLPKEDQRPLPPDTQFCARWARNIAIGNFLAAGTLLAFMKWGGGFFRFGESPAASALFIYPISIGVAVLGAQCSLFAVWAVFSPLSGWQRIGRAIGVMLLWCAAMLAGAIVFGGFAYAFVGTEGSLIDWEPLFAELVGALLMGLMAVISVIMYFLFFVLSIQTPLWLAKYFLRFRIVPPGKTLAEVPPVELRIKHLMIVTLVIAIGLGLVRAAAEFSGELVMEATLLVLLNMGIVGFLSLITLVPVVAITLGSEQKATAWGRSLLVGIGVPGMFFCLLAVLGGGAGAFFMPMLYVTAYAGGVIGVLMAARRAGYDFSWKRDVPQVETESAARPDTPVERMFASPNLADPEPVD